PGNKGKANERDKKGNRHATPCVRNKPHYRRTKSAASHCHYQERRSLFGQRTQIGNTYSEDGWEHDIDKEVKHKKRNHRKPANIEYYNKYQECIDHSINTE